MYRRRILLAAGCCILLLLCTSSLGLAQAVERVELRIDTSEADAVLAILTRREAGQPIRESDWDGVFGSEPYRRLRDRETSMRRSFTDDEFRQFVLSDDVRDRADALRRTLADWTSRDLEAAARRVLDYLPREARIRATVYPVIKPQTNSFVYDLRGNPAIFLYLDPEQSSAQFENTVAHELHHIGFASVGSQEESLAQLPPRVRTAVEWMGAFGEGFAMLAAAGSPEVHPHHASPAEDRERWDNDMARFNSSVDSLESFFLAVIDGELTAEEDIRERAFSFFGVQGPWYTVGYRMAAVVERRYGREELIAGMSDPRRLLARYNAAALESMSAGGEQLATWSPRLLEAIGAQ